MKRPQQSQIKAAPTVAQLARVPVEQRLAHLPLEPPVTALSQEDLAWVETDVDWEQDEP